MTPTSATGKRDWVYTGLLHARGVVLARSGASTNLRPGATILLSGDGHAAALLPFVRQLAVGAGVTVEFVPALGVDSFRSPGSLLKQPAVIAVSMPMPRATVADAVVLREMNERFRLLGSRLVWLRPPLMPQEIQPMRVLLRAAGIRSFPTETVTIHRAPSGGPSARGYAGWAGAFWRWLV